MHYPPPARGCFRVGDALAASEYATLQGGPPWGGALLADMFGAGVWLPRGATRVTLFSSGKGSLRNRSHPQRVVPLTLVLFSKIVEKAQKKDTGNWFARANNFLQIVIKVLPKTSNENIQYCAVGEDLFLFSLFQSLHWGKCASYFISFLRNFFSVFLRTFFPLLVHCFCHLPIHFAFFTIFAIFCFFFEILEFLELTFSS